jgi:hypothetical protein
MMAATVVAVLVLALIYGVLSRSLRGGQARRPPSTARAQVGNRENVPAAGWELQTVERGLKELGSPVNRAIPPLAITSTPAESMPHPMREKIRETFGQIGALHLRFAAAQFAKTSLGSGLWIVGGRGVSCAFRAGVGSGICQSAVRARKFGLLLETFKRAGTSEAPHDFLAQGLAPNSARSVQIRTAGTTRAIPILHHTYEVRAADPISLLRYSR